VTGGRRLYPPLWQYLSRLLATGAHVRPQRRRPPPAVTHFSCKAATSGGAEVGAMGADHGSIRSARKPGSSSATRTTPRTGERRRAASSPGSFNDHSVTRAEESPAFSAAPKIHRRVFAARPVTRIRLQLDLTRSPRSGVSVLATHHGFAPRSVALLEGPTRLSHTRTSRHPFWRCTRSTTLRSKQEQNLAAERFSPHGSAESGGGSSAPYGR
jgi:hypothetical protein